MKKKIALIIEHADVTRGGAERSALELKTALSDRGLEVVLLAARGHASAENIHILCGNSFGKRTCYFTFAKLLKKYLAENHYDIIHSSLPFAFADIYQPRGGAFAESISRNAASYRNKFLTSFKKITAFANSRRTILLQAEKKLCKDDNGPVIAALSQYVADQFKQYYGTAEHRITVIPNGIAIDKQVDTAEATKLRARILAQLNLSEADKPVLFLFVANNFRLKGLTCLIEAMHLATGYETPRQPHLIIAGSDKPHKYQQLAKKLNIDHKILFLGPLPHIQNALSIIDVAVLPTFYDPSSRFILEAIAAGKPVITTKFNGATDLFDDNRHGRVIDSPENTVALAQAISFFTHTGNIQKASQAIAEDNLKEKISIKRVAEQLESLYNHYNPRKG
ncbi:MAG: glycosyltransferase family 4 protein [Planctomycetota bacterium]|nr:MAG: glycosyltransferase family 4 protein [Planctomycetota bacterium]